MELSLSRLRTDHLDVLLVHSPPFELMDGTVVGGGPPPPRRSGRGVPGAGIRGLSTAQAALRFLLAEPEISTVIPGAESVEQLRANVVAADQPLPAETVDAIRTFGETERLR